MIDDAEARAVEPDVAVVSLYLRFLETLTESDIVLSIIIQLVQWSHKVPDVASLVLEVFNQKKGARKAQKPPFVELAKLMKDVIALFREVDILMDGIDEMKEKIQWAVSQAIISSKARLLLTSRHIHLLEERLKKSLGDELVFVEFAAPPEDMDLFVEGAIEDSYSLAALFDSDEAKQEVKNKIIEKAAGMCVSSIIGDGATLYPC